MRLIDADKLKNYLYSEPYYSDSINDRTYIREHIDEMPTVDAVPVSFIEAEIEQMHLETQIAVSEGDDERAERWIIRQVAVETVIAKWIAERKEE